MLIYDWQQQHHITSQTEHGKSINWWRRKQRVMLLFFSFQSLWKIIVVTLYLWLTARVNEGERDCSGQRILLHISYANDQHRVKCKSLCTTTVILCVFISNDEIIASFVKCVGLFLFLRKTKENARYFHSIQARRHSDSKTANMLAVIRAFRNWTR